MRTRSDSVDRVVYFTTVVSRTSLSLILNLISYVGFITYVSTHVTFRISRRVCSPICNCRCEGLGRSLAGSRRSSAGEWNQGGWRGTISREIWWGSRQARHMDVWRDGRPAAEWVLMERFCNFQQAVPSRLAMYVHVRFSRRRQYSIAPADTWNSSRRLSTTPTWWII